MQFAKIKKIKNITPIEPGSAHDIHVKGEAESSFLFDSSFEYPEKEEKGKFTLEVRLPAHAEIPAFSHVMIFGDSTFFAKVINWLKTSPDILEIELFVDVIFVNGFERSLQFLTTDTKGVFLFAENELRELNTYAAQKTIFDQLADIMLGPKTAEKIKALTRPCFALTISGESTKDSSHFVGSPKTPKGQPIPVSPIYGPLFHLATLKTGQFAPYLTAEYGVSLHQNLSFFIRIEDTENGWPEQASEFAVFNYDELTEHPPSSNFHEPEYELVFREKLDIPDSQDSTILVLKLSDNQEQQYEALRETLHSITEPDGFLAGNSKLFGYPDSVQGCAAYEADRLSTDQQYSDEHFTGGLDWQLLLQISPSTHDFKFFDHFGDGTIYFMIRKKDLLAGNFDQVQVVVQGT